RGLGARSQLWPVIWGHAGCALWLASVLCGAWFAVSAVAAAVGALDAGDRSCVAIAQDRRTRVVGNHPAALCVGLMALSVLRQLLLVFHGDVAALLPAEGARFLHHRHGQGGRWVFSGGCALGQFVRMAVGSLDSIWRNA